MTTISFDPASCVQRQLDAYNDRDLEGIGKVWFVTGN
jgi:hypothetical protein